MLSIGLLRILQSCDLGTRRGGRAASWLLTTRRLRLEALEVRTLLAAPVANPDVFGVYQNDVLEVDAPGVLANDFDAEGDTLTAFRVALPEHGSLRFSDDGAFTYTPEADFLGNDSFTYLISDGTALSAPATVTITVTTTIDPDRDPDWVLASRWWADGDSRPYTGDVNGDGTLELVTANFLPGPGLEPIAIDVQKGANQRSFIRFVDVTFTTEIGLQQLVDTINDGDPANDRIRLERFGLDGSGPPVDVALSGLVQVVGQSLAFDFGPQGMGGAPNSDVGDGYCDLAFDLDNDLAFGAHAYFYRLAGDTNGDRSVDISDQVAVAQSFGQSGSNLNEDVNGNGTVDISDLVLVSQNFGEELDKTLPLGLVGRDDERIHIYDAFGGLLSTISGVGELNILDDVTGDGQPEILASGRTETTLWIRALDANGTVVKSYAKTVSSTDTEITAHAVADLDGDGDLELVAVVGSGSSGDERGVVVFDAASGVEVGFLDIGPTPRLLSIGDVTGDGNLEIVFSSESSADGRTGSDDSDDSSSYVWCLDSTAATTWRSGPFNIGGFYDSTVMLADLDGNGALDVIAAPTSHGSSEWAGIVGRVMLLNPADGAIRAGYERDFGGPVEIGATADLDGDGDKEILVVHTDAAAETYYVRALNSTAGLPDWKVFNAGGSGMRPRVRAVNDVDGDGSLEVVVTAGNNLYVLNSDLTLAWEWSRPDNPDLPVNEVIISDTNEDGVNEIIVASGDSPGNQRVDVLVEAVDFNYTIRADGTEDLTTYPDQSLDWTVVGTGTETWYTQPNQNFNWTATATGTETWYTEETEHKEAEIYERLSASWEGESGQYKESFAASKTGVAEIDYYLRSEEFFDDSSRASFHVEGPSGTEISAWASRGEIVSGNESFGVLAGHTYTIHLTLVAPPHTAARGSISIEYDASTYQQPHTATRTATVSGSGTVNATQGQIVVGSRPYPQPQQGGTISGVSCSNVTDDNARVTTRCSGDLIFAGTDYSEAHTDEAEPGRDSGSGTVNAEEGETDMEPFYADPQPQHGGTIVEVLYEASSSNTNVTVLPVGGRIWAETDYTETETIPWSATESSSASVIVGRGEHRVATSSLSAPNDDAIWSVVPDSDQVRTRMEGPELYAVFTAEDDYYEPNDVAFGAYDLNSRKGRWLGSSWTGLAIQADNDWYHINVPPGDRRLIVDLSFAHTAGDVNLELVDVNGEVWASSTSADDDEHIDTVLPIEPVWYLRIYGENAGNTYDLRWDAQYVHPGDANLDGVTDLSDFNMWNANKFKAGTPWQEGDFNDDGTTDLSDFNIWNAHKFTQAPPPPPAHDVVLQQADRELLLDELAWFDSVRQADAKQDARGNSAAAESVDRLLATYWP